MMQSGVHQAQMVFLLLLLFVVVFAALARKLQTPYPIVLVIAGLLLGFVPGIHKIVLNPDLIFLVVLPPLLYGAAWMTSWREFKYNLVSICFLAFGLVGFTVLGVAGAAHWTFVGFDWRLGFVLGAVVATTDAIAATSIAKRVGLPQRIVDILEGESLLNDATGLLALEFGIAMVVEGTTPTVASGILRITYLTGVGLVVGLILGLGWTGMRGVVALAAAIALPEKLANGSPFPQRNLIVFLTFSVILVTLVVQGLTLPPLIRALGLGGAGGKNAEEEEARRIIASAALAQLTEARGQDLAEFGLVYEDIARRYTRRLASLSKESAENDELSTRASERYRTILKELLRVERKTAVRLRNDGRINDEVLRKIEHELDLSETRIALS